MSTARPFAYNPGTQIEGTIQVGDLSIGVPTSGFTNSPQYWNGPDEDLGYVIAAPVSGNTQPTPVSGVNASVGFYRTDGFNDSEFIDLAVIVSNEYGNPQTFSNASDASVWLTNNGFWNSFIPIPETPTPTVTTTQTPTPTATNSPTPTPSTPSGSVTGGTGTEVAYTTGTLFDAYSSRDGITNTDAFNTNNGCWQLYYAHQEIDINSGTANIGLNPYASGSNSWTWYYAVSNSVNTIGNWSSVQTLSSGRSGSYVGGVFTTSDINTNVTIPANTYFLIANSSGPFYRTVKSLSDNRTATVGGVPFVTAVNKVCLGNWPSGGTTLIPLQFGGAGTGYTLYTGASHVHSVVFR